MTTKKKYLVVGVILLLFFGIVVYAALGFGGGADGGRDGLAVIRVNGVIASTGSGSILSEGAAASHINSQIKRAAQDNRIKGILLSINSPGGSAAASQEIYRELEKFKETNKPIVVSMGDAAASGGYYIASLADYIMANPATLTGSIGVIMEVLDLSELYGKVGINAQTIKAGSLKDAGSNARPLGEEEREYFQDMADEIYQQFIDDVAKGRGLPRDEISNLADGRAILGSKAIELGLVDGLGNFYDAWDKLKELAGIIGEPPVIELEKKTFWQNAFGLSFKERFDLIDVLKELVLFGAEPQKIKLLFQLN